MAIALYAGTVGGGKSFSAVRQMLECLAAGRYVTSNIRLLWPGVVAYCKAYWNIEPSEGLYTYLDTREKCWQANKYTVEGKEGAESLLVLDECNLLFPARGWKANAENAQEFLDWAVQSRKYGVDCIFIIQNVKNLDVTIARQAATEWRFRDWRKVKLPFLSSWAPWCKWPWHQITASCFDLESSETKAAAVLTYKADGRIYSCYKTLDKHKDFEMKTPMTEARTRLDYEGRKKAQWKYAAVLVVLLTGLVAGCSSHERKQYEKLNRDCEALRLKLSQSLVAATNLAAAAKSAVMAAGKGSTVAGGHSAGTLARFAYIAGFADAGEFTCVTTLDGLTVRVGDWWPDVAGTFMGINGAYALVRDSDGLRCVSLLKRRQEEPKEDRQNSGAVDVQRVAYSQ